MSATVMSSQVLEVGEPTLAELAARINRNHALVGQALNEAVARAIDTGTALVEARALVRQGEWATWLAQNCELPYYSAVFYMRLARHRELVMDARTLKEARALTVGQDRPTYVSHTRHALAEEARQLHREGTPKCEIAKRLEVDKKTVSRWVDPAYHKRQIESQRRRSERWLAGREALRQQEQEQALKRAVKKAGAATQEAWAMAERMQDVLAQAQRETEDREARRALAQAGEHHRKMRDEIVRALGVV